MKHYRQFPGPSGPELAVGAGCLGIAVLLTLAWYAALIAVIGLVLRWTGVL